LTPPSPAPAAVPLQGKGRKKKKGEKKGGEKKETEKLPLQNIPGPREAIRSHNPAHLITLDAREEEGKKERKVRRN